MHDIYQARWDDAVKRCNQCQICGKPVTRDCSECSAPLCDEHFTALETCGGAHCDQRAIGRARGCAA